MALTSIIAHRIYRHSPGSAFELQLRGDAFTSDGKLEELAYELKTQFIRKGGKSYGRFSDELGECPLPAWLRDYRDERLSFISFTHKTMQQFQQVLEKAELLDSNDVNLYILKTDAYLALDQQLKAVQVNIPPSLSFFQFLIPKPYIYGRTSM